jgi:hypothetical protein
MRLENITTWIIGFITGIILAPKLTTVESITLTILAYIGLVYVISKIFKVIKR